MTDSVALPGQSLSPRQTQIVELVALGLRDKDIAARLGISPATVKNHITSIFIKSACSSRLQVAIKYCYLNNPGAGI